MKITQIKIIKSYKSFHDFSWRKFFGDDNFHNKVNIFYGENGSGKTAICNIFKSLSGYKDFSKYRPKEAVVETDHNEALKCKYSSSNQDWGNKVEKDSILFFDKEFVDQNVHLESDRGKLKDQQEQKSGQLLVGLDAKARKLREARNKLKDEKDDAEKDKKKFKKDNEKDWELISDTGLFEKYKNKTPQELDEIKDELTQKDKVIKRKLSADEKAQQRIVEISNISAFKIIDDKITISDQQKYQELFDLEIKEQAKVEAEQTLIDKLKEHQKFFKEGIDIRKTHPEKCPFCQSTKEEENIKKVIEAYNDIYDDSYKKQLEKFNKEKNALLDELDRVLEAHPNPEEIFHETFDKLEKLSHDYNIKDIYSPDEKLSLKRRLETKNIQALRTKIQNLERPNKENITETYTKAAKEAQDMSCYLTSLNELREKNNGIIKKFKLDNSDYEKIEDRIKKSRADLGQVEKEIDFISKNLAEKTKLLNNLNKKHSDTKDAHKKACEEYENYCLEEVFQETCEKTKEYFEASSPDLTLKSHSESQASRKKEFPFAFKVLAAGRERDFKEGLSEGERQVLSLCFFFALLDRQENKEEKILVFDDPVTSLDNNNLSFLVDLITQKTKEFSQTFVFTHHRVLFKFLRNRFSSAAKKKSQKANEYNILKNKKELGGSFICKSAEKMFICKLEKLTDLGHIRSDDVRFDDGTDVELKTVEYGQYLRYEVERFIKYELLHWDAGSNLPKAIEELKKSQNVANCKLNKLKDIYSFCNWTTSHVDVGDDHGLCQLKQKVESFLEVFNSYKQQKGK